MLGSDIYQALLSVRYFHQQVALLLSTIDTYMHPKGWEVLEGKIAISDGSYSLEKPIQWMPSMAFRYYHHKDLQNIVLFASVIFCPRGVENHGAPWREPLISAGWIRFATPTTLRKQAWAALIVETDSPRDGTLYRWTSPDGKPHEAGSTEECCLAVPLVEITTTTLLISRVLEPVIKSLPHT